MTGMGKGSTGAGWTFLLLVGVLLAAAAMPTAVGQWGCDAQCVVSHTSDPWNIPMCVYRCHSSMQAAADRNSWITPCEGDCIISFAPDMMAASECIGRCRNGVIAGSNDAVGGGEDHDRCQKMCQTHSDLMEQLQCMLQCSRQQGAVVKVA